MLIRCTRCNGKGVLYGGPGMYEYNCPVCKGKGKIDSPEAKPDTTDH